MGVRAASLTVIASVTATGSLLGYYSGRANTEHTNITAYTTAARVLPAGVPASYAGTLRQSLTGYGLYKDWSRHAGGGGDCWPANGRITVTRQRWLDLHTTGQVGDCAQIRSTAWTAGVFEARIWFPGMPGGGVPDWPAFWMSGRPWPNEGEIDAAEGGWSAYFRCLAVTYHWNAYGPHGRYSPASTGPTCITTAVPAWELIDIVRKPSGVVEVWWNGRLRWSHNTGMAPRPENIMFDITAAYPGRPADVFVRSIRIWNFR